MITLEEFRFETLRIHEVEHKGVFFENACNTCLQAWCEHAEKSLLSPSFLCLLMEKMEECVPHEVLNLPLFGYKDLDGETHPLTTQVRATSDGALLSGRVPQLGDLHLTGSGQIARLVNLPRLRPDSSFSVWRVAISERLGALINTPSLSREPSCGAALHRYVLSSTPDKVDAVTMKRYEDITFNLHGLCPKCYFFLDPTARDFVEL